MLIYKITNKINGKVYIGQTANFYRRWNAHCSPHSKSALSAAVRKHGADSFTLCFLGEYTHQEDLNNAEDYYIELYQSLSPGGYNLVTGQQKNRIWSAQSLQKASESKLGPKNPMFGIRTSEETRKKRSAAQKGKPKSPETKEKLRQANLGKKATARARANMSKAARNSTNPGRFIKGRNNHGN